MCIHVHITKVNTALYFKVDEGKTNSLMDEFVKDVAASNMGMSLNSIILISYDCCVSDVKESGFKGKLVS